MSHCWKCTTFKTVGLLTRRCLRMPKMQPVIVLVTKSEEMGNLFNKLLQSEIRNAMHGDENIDKLVMDPVDQPSVAPMQEMRELWRKVANPKKKIDYEKIRIR